MESRRHAYASGTYKNFFTHWVKYLTFCVYFNIAPFPAQTTTLSWYAQFLSRSLRAHASIVACLSSVKTLHKLLCFSTVGFTGFYLKLTLQGLKRRSVHTVKRALPITPAILRKVYLQLNHNLAEDAVFWGACLTAFFLLSRKSNLIPDSPTWFDKEKQLTRADVVFTDVNAVVGIRWAKNHQFTRELLTFPLPKLPGSVLCPHTALINSFRLVPGVLGQHLFTLWGGGGGGNSLYYREFQNKLRNCLKSANVFNYQSYSSHSFRRGSMTFAFLCRIPGPIIKLLGNWKSDCYLKYIEFPLETCTAACELMKQRILNWESVN